MNFDSLSQAKRYERDNADLISMLQKETEAIDGVLYSEVWLNGNPPSFVAGFNNEDEHIVSLKL